MIAASAESVTTPRDLNEQRMKMYSKQTKIICTIAGQKCEQDFIRKLYKNGMNVARLNTAHITTEQAAEIVQNIRAVSDTIGILIDTKGPEVRIQNLEQPITITTGDRIEIAADFVPENGFQVNFDGFISAISVGSDILIDDGELCLAVTEKTATSLVCKAMNDGEIKNRKSVNVPDAKMNMPSLTEKDADFIIWATQNNIDFIAHSFVRNRDDVMAVQTLLDIHKSDIKIIAKIENREGVENLDAILDVAHGIMVARGDLGIEIPAEQVPIIQKQLIQTCIKRVKPVITATQMLHTMIENPRPTRAEVSDVANAIYDGTDAVMLSGETAYGKYPVEAVMTMTQIARAVEQQKASEFNPLLKQQHGELKTHSHLAKSAVFSATTLPLKVIITSTKSGDTAQLCASYRGTTPIFAFSQSERTVRRLSLCYGVFAAQMDIPDTTDELVRKSLNRLLDDSHIGMEDLIVFIGGGHIYSAHTNFLQIDTPATLLARKARA